MYAERPNIQSKCELPDYQLMAADLNAGVMEGELAGREDEATALEAVEIRVRRHQAWKAKRKMSEQQELEEIGHLGKVHHLSKSVSGVLVVC